MYIFKETYIQNSCVADGMFEEQAVVCSYFLILMVP
jgi:hypothetical protein